VGLTRGRNCLSEIFPAAHVFSSGKRIPAPALADERNFSESRNDTLRKEAEGNGSPSVSERWDSGKMKVKQGRLAGWAQLPLLLYFSIYKEGKFS